MCIGVLASCAASACMGCCCSGMKDCQAKHGPASRIGYIFLMFIMCIYAVIMTLYGDNVIYENDLLNYSFVICDSSNEACQSNGSVYRVSFCLFLFFIIHAIVIKCSFGSFHWLFLTWKIFTLIAVLVVTYFIPNDPFDAYAQFARFASFVFLLLQVLILISWAYDVNERFTGKIADMADNMDEDADRKDKINLRCHQCMLVFATLCVYIGIGIFIGFQYSWFDNNGNGNCSLNSTILGFTIVIILISTFLPIVLQTGYLFTTAVVSFYMTYLCYAGLENYPETDCNHFANAETSGTMWVGIIVTTVAISYVGFSVSKQSGVLLENGGAAPTESNINMELEAGTNKKKGKDKGDDAGTAADSNYEDDADLGESNYDDAAKKGGDKEEVVLSESQEELERKANVMFHLCMAFASVYMAMLYTNWGTNTYDENDSSGRGYESLWVNIVAQWVTFVLFIWTAVAPRVCPSRFGISNGDDE